MKLIIHITHFYHHNHSNITTTEMLINILLSSIIMLHAFYIAVILIRRYFEDYETRKAFLIDLIIPFRLWIITIFRLFLKP